MRIQLPKPAGSQLRNRGEFKTVVFGNGSRFLVCVFDGTHLHLSWPVNCLGWELQAQTNSRSVGLGTNWSPVPGSTTNTQLSIPINPASPSVFYRLHYQ